MNKKLIAAILAATTALSAAPFALAENDENTNDKVEIAFNVGDSILKINGVETEVETPYVTENNTTLVPLRVITEAFGAKVDWDGDTQKITLTYPAVNIELQIGNIVATVNDHTETLLESPALSENGVTMVPLRFISETFGATVGYDNDTQAILVTKENMDNSSTVTGITDMTRTGDSYYLWSIDTPTQMKMDDRTLDAVTTKFVADDESSMYIEVYPITEDTVDFDEEYSKRKDSFSSYTLINAEKLPESNGTQHMHFQAKNKEQIIDFHEYYTKDYRYLITSLIKINDDTSTKDMILSLVDSFKIGKIDNETYDLSTVKTEGTRQYREITDDTYKVSFYVPANYQMEDDNTENEFTFYEPKNESTSHISLGIYSKTGDTTAYSLATNDHAIREKYASTKYSTLTPVSETGTNSYKYTQTISGSTDSDLYTVDTFFEKGDYVYNFAVTTNLDYDEMELNTILNSIKAEELDSSKIGKLMRNDPEDTLTTVKVDNYQFSVPASWKPLAKSNQGISYTNTYTTSGIIYSYQNNSEFKQTNLSSVANAYSKYLTQDEANEIYKKIEYTSINGKRYAYFTVTTKSKSDSKTYGTVYITCDNGTAHIFTLIQNEVFYGSAETNDFEDIVSSLQSK